MQVKYTGSVEACCPITLVPFTELRAPVSFRDTPQHVYECEDLLQWLQIRPVNPATNLEISWHLSPLEAIGPVAGMAGDPGLVESTIVKHLDGDAMPLIRILSSHWFWIHVIMMFLLVTANIIASQYLFYGDCLAIVFAVTHWYWNAGNSREKKLSFFTVISVLFVGKCQLPRKTIPIFILTCMVFSAACCVSYGFSCFPCTQLDMDIFWGQSSGVYRVFKWSLHFKHSLERKYQNPYFRACSNVNKWMHPELLRLASGLPPILPRVPHQDVLVLRGKRLPIGSSKYLSWRIHSGLDILSQHARIRAWLLMHSDQNEKVV